MFDSLAEKLQGTLADVRRHGTLTAEDIDAAMREIRLALLEADVNFKVVKTFTNAVKERALGADVIGKLNPGQQVVKIVSDQLTELMGGAARDLTFSPRPPTVVVMAGLQGSGKTTATAKLARYLKEQHGSSVAVAACDVYRPAAVDQLIKVGAQAGATVYEQGTDQDPVKIAAWARDRAQSEGKDVLIVDTSGRLHVDQELMAELANIKKAVKPHDVLLVVDAMTGQDAVNVAEQFAEVVQFDGVVMTKLDGDARGGAALSVKAITGKPILFASTGEKLDQFERFHPDRMAQRILGMGDVMTLIEKAETAYDQDQAAELERKLRKQEFGLDDFLEQMRQVRRLGPLQSLIGMIPGMGKELRGVKVDEREFDRIQAIILSMTPQERRHPELIKGSRRLRIAQGSGTNVQAYQCLSDLADQWIQVGTGQFVHNGDCLTANGAAVVSSLDVVDAPVKVAHTAAGPVGYREVGTGSPLLLITGFGASIDSWQPAFVAALAADHQVVALDNAGVGQTAGLPSPVSITAMANQTSALISALRLGRVAVLGWSMGGMIAQALAVLHPAQVSRLVLAATQPGTGKAVPIPAAAAAAAASSAPGRVLSVLFPPGQVAAAQAYALGILRYPDIYQAPPAVTAEQAVAVSQWMAGQDPAGREIGDIRIPTLVADGTLDALDPVADDRQLAGGVPGAKLILYPGAGHAFLFQDSASFLPAVQRFLS